MTDPSGAHVPAGLLLAAGAGRRFGAPKALATDADGTAWLPRTIDTLLAVCDPVTVVLGAAADQARQLLGDRPVRVVVNAEWDQGMGSSLRTGLADLEATGTDGALVTLVDLPDVTPDVVRRVAGAHRGPHALARATYADGPGHPVLIGRDHWPDVMAAATGDRGARDFLAGRAPELVDCADLATGRDVDTRDEARDPG